MRDLTAKGANRQFRRRPGLCEWKFKAEAVVKGESAITEFIEHKPLEGKIPLIDEPVVMMPNFIFTSITQFVEEDHGRGA